MKHLISWLLVAALYLSCSSAETSTREESPAGVSAQKSLAEGSNKAELFEASSDQKMTWEQYMDEGLEAYERGRYGQAEKLYLAALEKAEAFGDRDPRLGSTLKNLAELYRSQGKNDKAEQLYQRLLAVSEKMLGSEHLHLATILDTLAIVYQERGKYEEAGLLYERQVVLLLKALGRNSEQVALALEKHAVMLRKIDRHQEADELEDRANEIWMNRRKNRSKRL